jgi:hypothetical protein
MMRTAALEHASGHDSPITPFIRDFPIGREFALEGYQRLDVSTPVAEEKR